MWYLTLTQPGRVACYALGNDANKAAGLVPAAKAHAGFPTNVAWDGADFVAQLSESDEPPADLVDVDLRPRHGAEYAKRELAERLADVKATALAALGELNEAELREVLLAHAETLKG